MNSKIVKVLSSQFIGGLGSQCLSFALGLFILRETQSVILFGLILCIGPLGTLILTPWIGYFTDKLNRKKVAIYAQLSSVLFLLLFLVVNEYYENTIWVILLVFFLSICDRFLNTAFTAALFGIVGESHIERVNAWLQMVSSSIMILAPILGSILYTFNSFSIYVFIVIISELIAAIILGTIPFGEHEQNINKDNSSKEKVFENFKSGLSYVKNKPFILFVLSIGVSINVFVTALTVGLPFILINHFQVRNIEYGIVEIGLAIGILCCGYYLSKRPNTNLPINSVLKYIYLISLFILLAAIPFFLNIPIFTITIYYFILNFLVGYLSIFVNTPIMTRLHLEIDDNYKGRVFNLIFTIISVLNPIGILIFSLLFEFQAPSLIFIISGILMAISMFSAYHFNKHKLEMVINDL